MTTKFEEMNLSPQLVRAIFEMGYEEATPIQARSINVIRQGKDVIGQSRTGTGKTAAFAIPCLEMVDPEDRNLQAIILCPTRELAIQVSEEFRKLMKFKEGIRVVPIYGGQPIDRQIFALKKGAQVVIGTPGRTIDHINRHTLKMQNVKMVVLDEADEMLDMGFREDIEKILEKIPDQRQMVLFSATMSKEILELTKTYQKEPEMIQSVFKELTVPSIDQCYIDVKQKAKLEATCRIIDMYNPDLTMIFCNTKRKVDELTEQLQGRGYFAEGLHGDLKQIQRDRVMNKFRNGNCEILVATDVAARGIDVENIDLVINYDIPQDEEYYVHRIGRTGRAGKSGKAITFVVGKEIYKLKDIMRYSKTKINKINLPSLNDVEEAKIAAFSEKVRQVMEEGRLSKYINIIENIMTDEYNTMDVAAALLKMQLANEIPTNYDADDFENEYKDIDDKSMIRLTINAGKTKQIKPKDVVGALAGETGVPGKVIGAIDIYDDYTIVDVPKEYAKDILQGMAGGKIKGTRIVIKPDTRSKKRTRRN